MKDFWKNKNVFLTGINGFIGGNLAKVLIENGADVNKKDSLGRGLFDDPYNNSFEFKMILAGGELDIETDLAIFIGQYKLDTETTEEYSKKYPQNEPFNESNFISQFTEYSATGKKCISDMKLCLDLFSLFMKSNEKKDDVEKKIEKLHSDFSIYLDMNIKLVLRLRESNDPESMKKDFWEKLPLLSALQEKLYIRIQEMINELKTL